MNSYQDMTGRELILANRDHSDEPEFRAAFMTAILAGKFQGMTQGCFQGILATTH
jgi:hypothetical protein